MKRFLSFSTDVDHLLATRPKQLKANGHYCHSCSVSAGWNQSTKVKPCRFYKHAYIEFCGHQQENNILHPVVNLVCNSKAMVNISTVAGAMYVFLHTSNQQERDPASVCLPCRLGTFFYFLMFCIIGNTFAQAALLFPLL